MSDTNFEEGFYQRLLDIHGVESDTELAREVGKSTSTVHNWKIRKNIPISVCVQIARDRGVSLDWLIFGKGEVAGSTGQTPAAYRVDDGAPIDTSSAMPEGDMTPVRMYDIEAAAGSGRSLGDEPIKTTLYFPAGELSAMGLAPERVAGIKVRGDSMDGTLTDGDWVLVDLANRDPKQEGVFLLLISGERRIKRVQRLAGGALQLISDNSHYPPEMIKPEEMHDVEILGRCEIRIGRVS